MIVSGYAMIIAQNRQLRQLGCQALGTRIVNLAEGQGEVSM